MKETCAFLGNKDGFTVFRYQNHIIRFKAPYSLERYTSVKKWDHGYLVVMAKYAHRKTPEEEYIDLNPILENLYISPAQFLEPIKEVRISLSVPKIQTRDSMTDEEFDAVMETGYRQAKSGQTIPLDKAFE